MHALPRGSIPASEPRHHLLALPVRHGQRSRGRHQCGPVLGLSPWNLCVQPGHRELLLMQPWVLLERFRHSGLLAVPDRDVHGKLWRERLHGLPRRHARPDHRWPGPVRLPGVPARLLWRVCQPEHVRPVRPRHIHERHRAHRLPDVRRWYGPARHRPQFLLLLRVWVVHANHWPNPLQGMRPGYLLQHIRSIRLPDVLCRHGSALFQLQRLRGLCGWILHRLHERYHMHSMSERHAPACTRGLSVPGLPCWNVQHPNRPCSLVVHRVRCRHVLQRIGRGGLQHMPGMPRRSVFGHSWRAEQCHMHAVRAGHLCSCWSL